MMIKYSAKPIRMLFGVATFGQLSEGGRSFGAALLQGIADLLKITDVQIVQERLYAVIDTIRLNQ